MPGLGDRLRLHRHPALHDPVPGPPRDFPLPPAPGLLATRLPRPSGPVLHDRRQHAGQATCAGAQARQEGRTVSRHGMLRIRVRDGAFWSALAHR